MKLCRGGGQEVTHSSEFANPTGPSAGTLCPNLQVLYTLYRQKSVEAPRMNEPIVEIRFSMATFPGRSG